MAAVAFSRGLERVERFLAGEPGAGIAASVAGGPAPGRRRLSSAHIGTEQEGPAVEIATGGSFLRVSIPGRGGGGGGVRGAVEEFTAASRRRLLGLVNSINRELLPACRIALCTLTYPGEDFPGARESKLELKAFLRRLARDWPGVSGLWKLEPQKRGAPHYHLLLFASVGAVDWVQVGWWAASCWHELVGAGDVNHLSFHRGHLTGRPCVEQIRDWCGVASYAAKYLCKPAAVEGWKNPGRWWGKHRVELLPVEVVKTVLSPRAAALLRRAVVRWFEHQESGWFFVPGRSLPGGFLRGRRVHGSELIDVGGGERQRLSACAAELAELIGRPVRRVRRRWAWSRGGVSCFMPAAAAGRLVEWATAAAGVGRWAVIT